MTTSSNFHRGLRFPPEIIERAVWLYHRFSQMPTMMDSRGCLAPDFANSCEDAGL